jgi:hypothetical protein
VLADHPVDLRAEMHFDALVQCLLGLDEGFLRHGDLGGEFVFLGTPREDFRIQGGGGLARLGAHFRRQPPGIVLGKVQ